MMSILSAVFNSLLLFIDLKNKLAYYDLQEKSRIRIKQIIDEIENLRSTGDSNDADHADFLREELTQEKLIYKDILKNISNEK